MAAKLLQSGRRIDLAATEWITDAIKWVMMAVDLILLPQSVVGVSQS